MTPYNVNTEERKFMYKKASQGCMSVCVCVWFCLLAPLNGPAGARYGMCGIVVDTQKAAFCHPSKAACQNLYVR